MRSRFNLTIKACAPEGRPNRHRQPVSTPRLLQYLEMQGGRVVETESESSLVCKTRTSSAARSTQNQHSRKHLSGR
jgi:hypothetical protein